MGLGIKSGVQKFLRTLIGDRTIEAYAQKRYDHSQNPFKWEQGPMTPLRTVESHGVVVDDKYYLFGGYLTIGEVSRQGIVFDLKNQKWLENIPMADGVAETHTGIVTDGKRYIYFIGGQDGPHCRPCVDWTSVYDTHEKKWQSLLPLPEKRYIGAICLWQDRIYVVGGTLEDRHTPATDHWSIGVKDGMFMDNQWKIESSIPRGGNHSGWCLYKNEFYVVGGIEGDVIPVKGDPEFRCDWVNSTENIHGEMYKYTFATEQWTQLASMPVPLGHIDSNTLIRGNNIFTFGGTPVRGETLVEIYCYSIEEDMWRMVGRTPYHMKSTCVFVYDDWVYMINGQRSRNEKDIRPKHLLNTMWRAKFPT